MFNDALNRYATPFTTGLFVVSTVSGVALFFHVGAAAFHGMHEWLSMLLILPFVFHVWKNWGPLTKYFERGWLMWPLGLSLIAALVFVVPSLTGGGEGGGNPQMAMFRALSEARIVDVAPVLKLTPERIVEKLKAEGIAVTSTETTMTAAAQAAGKDARQAVFAVLSGK